MLDLNGRKLCLWPEAFESDTLIKSGVKPHTPDTRICLPNYYHTSISLRSRGNRSSLSVPDVHLSFRRGRGRPRGVGVPGGRRAYTSARTHRSSVSLFHAYTLRLTCEEQEAGELKVATSQKKGEAADEPPPSPPSGPHRGGAGLSRS